MKEQLRRIPALDRVAGQIRRFTGGPARLDQLQQTVEALARAETNGSQLHAELGALRSELTALRCELESVAARVPTPAGETPGLAEALVGLADMSTAWAANYTKPVDETYVFENHRHHLVMFDLVEELAQRVAPERPPRLIEVGMGLGTMSIYLSRHNYEVTGVDQDALQVARARQLCRELGGFARFLCMDLFDLSLFQPDAFDVAFSQGTLEHLSPSEVERAFHEQLRIAPYVVFSVPSVDWTGPEFGDERRLTTDEWRVAVESAGLKPLVLHYYGTGRWHVLGAVGRPGLEPAVPSYRSTSPTQSEEEEGA